MEGALAIDVDSFYSKGWLSCKIYHPNQVFDLEIGVGTDHILQHNLVLPCISSSLPRGACKILQSQISVFSKVMS